MQWMVWGPLLLAALGGLLVLAGLGSLLRFRLFKAGGRLLVGGAFALAGFAVALIGVNIQTYARLSYERPVAAVGVEAIDLPAKRYRVTIRHFDPYESVDRCDIQGDEWILSARVRIWKPWVNVLGLDSGYTFDQVANKYISASEANGKPITACDIRTPDPPVNRYVPEEWLAWLMSLAVAEERRFGSASYMPLADGAAYAVIMTQSGLNAEPANDAARAAVAR